MRRTPARCRSPRIALAVVPALVAAALVLLPARPAAAQGWPALTPEEKAMTDCPLQPGADAVWLYREIVEDQEDIKRTVFKRLKILKESGRDHANIEIPYYSGSQKVSNLEARLIGPNGTITPFTGQVFDKTALRYRRLRVALKTFAVPDVEVGSIIDLRYKIEADLGGSSGSDDEDLSESLQLSGSHPTEGGMPRSSEFLSFPAAHWDLQDDLFTVRAKYRFVSFPYIGLLFMGPCRLSWVSHNLEPVRPEIKNMRLELSLENIPPFEGEELMTSEQAEQISLDVFYLAAKISDRDEYWKRESRAWQKAAERFIGDPDKVSAKALELIGDETDPAGKLKRLYAGVQKIRNLSYEKGLTRNQRKAQDIKSNRGVVDVIGRGYGVRSDITRTFVALARAAGFEAEPVRIANRDDKIFRVSLWSFYSQLDAEAAQVKLGGQALLFDPATPFCPFGLVHWTRSNAAGLRYSDAPPAFFVTPASPPDQGLTRREAALALDLRGGLAGTVRTTYTGHKALIRRLEHIHDDAGSRTKDLEKELADALPMGAAVSLTKLENADGSDPDLVATFSVSIPGLGAVAGDKMILPVSPLAGEAQYPFRHAERRYPVYFPFPYREIDDIVVTLPEGLAAEVRPEDLKEQNDFASYSLACALEGPRRLRVRRDLVIRKSFFPIEQYKTLKALFDRVRAGDEAQVVLAASKKPPI
ncbi:MAG: DUF3857 domain-containing protein [Acidobacteriota bacterium]